MYCISLKCSLQIPYSIALVEALPVSTMRFTVPMLLLDTKAACLAQRKYGKITALQEKCNVKNIIF